LLELKPDDMEGLQHMEVLCQKQERWPELADVLGKRLQLLGPDADVELKFKLGAVREAKLLDKFGAMELYGQILKAFPNHAGTLQRVEGIVQREPQNQVAVEALLKAYRANGDAAKLAQLVEIRVGVSQDPQER